METEIEKLLYIKNERDFYIHLIYIMNIYEEDSVYDYLEKNNIKISKIKLYSYMILFYRKIYTYIVDNKEFPVEQNYNKILKTYSELASKLGIETPLEKSIFFSKLLYMGYFSRYIYLKYDEDAFDDFLGPYVVITGKGCCRNFSLMLKDFLKCSNVECDTYINYLISGDICLLEEVIGNHMSVIIKDDNFDYIYDPTNECPIIKAYLNKYKSTDNNYKFKNRDKIIDKYNIVSKDNYKEFQQYYEEALFKVDNIIDKYKYVLDETHNMLIDDFKEIMEFIEEAKRDYRYRTRKK